MQSRPLHARAANPQDSAAPSRPRTSQVSLLIASPSAADTSDGPLPDLLCVLLRSGLVFPPTTASPAATSPPDRSCPPAKPRRLPVLQRAHRHIETERAPAPVPCPAGRPCCCQHHSTTFEELSRLSTLWQHSSETLISAPSITPRHVLTMRTTTLTSTESALVPLLSRGCKSST